MVVPEVDKKLLGELEVMGFPLVHATRALYYSGNSSLEDAVNWIIDHENDSDIDQMPLVPVDIYLDAPKPFDVTELVKRKAEELRNRACRSLKDKEKQLEREKEKERIQAGNKIQDTAQITEENARKRMVALRQTEKKEENRAREIVLQKLEADKAERRSKLGPSSAVSSSTSLAPRAMHERMNSSHVTTPMKAEILSNCLRTMRRIHKDDDARVQRAFQTLMIYVRNVVKNPDVEKFRKICLTNPIFQERVGNLTGGVKFLELCGFERTNEGHYLYLPRYKLDLRTLNLAMSTLNSALTNPYFGLLSVEP